MSVQFNSSEIILPPITSEGCKAIKKIFSRYNNIDQEIAEKIISMLRKDNNENYIMKSLNISKNKLYRYVCYWIVKNEMGMPIKRGVRGYGKNNYNKFDATISGIIYGLENCFTVTELCRDVGLAHQTMVKYLHRLLNEESDVFFG